jgi:hypothetical protein
MPQPAVWWFRIAGNAAVALMLPFMVHALFPGWAPYGWAVSVLVLFALGRAAWREWNAGNPR